MLAAAGPESNAPARRPVAPDGIVDRANPSGWACWSLMAGSVAGMCQEPLGQPAPAGGLAISQMRFEGVPVVAVVGAVDVATGTRLRAELGAALADPAPGPVLVDLTEVSYMSSTGVAVLCDAQWEAGERGRPLRLVLGDNRVVSRLLRTTGVDQLLEQYPSRADALRGHGPQG